MVDHQHQGTIISDSTPIGPGIGLLRWAILPLIPSIFFLIFFLASGKVIF